MTVSTFRNTMMLIFALASLVACAPAQKMAVSARSTGTVTGNGSTSGSLKTCRGSAAVYDAGGGSGTFEQRAKALISGTTDPANFGTIDGTGSSNNCISITARLNYDSSGNVNVSQSTMKMLIYDSLAGTVDTSTGQTYGAYPIEFSAATSGQVNASSKTFTLTFSDSYGSIVLTGTLGSPTTTVTVSFQNNKNYSSTGTASSGTLGVFTVNTSTFAY